MRLASTKEQVSGPIQISLIHRAIQAVLRTHLSFLTHLRTPEERSQPGENHYTNTYLPSRDSRAGGIGWLTKMRLPRQGAVLVRKHHSVEFAGLRNKTHTDLSIFKGIMFVLVP